MTAHDLSKIALENSVSTKLLGFEDKIITGTNAYVDFVIKKCTEIALKGYGGCRLNINKSVDLGDMDEYYNKFYSLHQVLNILGEKEFTMKLDRDYVDTTLYFIIWNKDLQISKALISSFFIT